MERVAGSFTHDGHHLAYDVVGEGDRVAGEFTLWPEAPGGPACKVIRVFGTDVAGARETDVIVYDLATGAVRGVLRGYVTPRNIVFAPDGKSFYVSDSSLGTVTRLDTTTLKPLAHPPALLPVFVHLALVLMLGLYMPPYLVTWYHQAAAMLG